MNVVPFELHQFTVNCDHLIAELPIVVISKRSSLLSIVVFKIMAQDVL